MSEDLSKVLDVALKAALAAGTTIKSFRDEGFDLSFKGERDLLTTADVAAERCITDAIHAAFPGHSILAEESAPTLADPSLLRGPLWIIDPIDGTMNFVHNHHQVGVSIAFADRGKVQVGVVHSPFQQETYHAVIGRGARMNDLPIQVSSPGNLQSTLIATGFPAKRDNLAPIVRRVSAVLASCRDIRRLGAASLDVSWVAHGRIDAFYESLCVWDVAAARLIAREAGARTGNFSAVPEDLIGLEDFYCDDILIAPPSIYSELHELLQRATQGTFL